MLDPMTSLVPVLRTPAVCLMILLALGLVAAGCTQPVLPQVSQTPVPGQQQNVPAPVTVTRTDTGHITVAYPGTPETITLLELEVTVTDSRGETQTKSVGSRLSNTPLRYGATLPFTGTFTGNNHVVVTGYFTNGSPRTMLDTTV